MYAAGKHGGRRRTSRFVSALRSQWCFVVSRVSFRRLGSFSLGPGSVVCLSSWRSLAGHGLNLHAFAKYRLELHTQAQRRIRPRNHEIVGKNMGKKPQLTARPSRARHAQVISKIASFPPRGVFFSTKACPSCPSVEIQVPRRGFCFCQLPRGVIVPGG